MKRYIKHIIGPILFVIIVAGAIRFVTSVYFGAVTIDVVKLISGVGIEYDEMSGNILTGFRISNYRVRLSETDSICGARADVYYRFNPFMLRLPNLFEVNLLEPMITMQQKASAGGRGFRGLPNLRLGLRVNLKNGQILYRNREQYTIDHISGIVFLDLVGRTTRLATMNLSLQSAERSIYINSLTLDAEIDDEQIRLRSFKLSGAGLALEGKGYYDYSSEYAEFDIVHGQVDLQKIKKREGMIDFKGSIAYDHGDIQPKIRGTAVRLPPFTEFGFETNASADTIWVNVFDCAIMGGCLFAQLRVTGLKDVQLAMNFKELDISGLLGAQAPVLSNGYISYADGRFSGFADSPRDLGLGLDSVFFYGTYADSGVRLDSLFVVEGGRSLFARGAILPHFDLEIEFSDFSIDRFKEILPVAGRLNGSTRVTGELDDLLNLRLTSYLSVKDASVYNLSADSLFLQSTDFQQSDIDRRLQVMLRDLRYGDLHIERSTLSIEDSTFRFAAADEDDSLYLDGLLRANLEGVICSLMADFNGVITRSIEPIGFDIMHRTLGDVRLAFGDGLLHFSRVPLSMELMNIDLTRIGRLLGLTDSMSGVVDVKFVNDTIDIRARDICYLGVANGVLELNGYYSDGKVQVESLHVHDDRNQVLDAHGVLSLDQSDLTATFSDVGVWVLAFLKNFLGNPDGLMTGQVSLRGNIEKFEFSGGGKIHDGSFSVDIIAAQFDSVDTDVVFEGDKIIFMSGKGLMSPKNGRALSSQWINGGGVVKLEERFRVDNLNFDFSFVDAPLQFPPFAYGIGSGNFSLAMRDRIMYYSGNIAVAEAVIPLEFGMKIKEEQAVQNENWHLNLRLKADRNVWLRNPDADIEFGGELSITREDGPVFLSGVLETDRGNYYWVNHILAITQGRVTFIPGDEIDPDLDFWAELDTREGVKIILHLTGSISEPIFEFYTDPPGQYTEQDIVTFLNLNITWQELEQLKRGEYMSRIIPQSLLAWLEGDISRAIRQYTGLDYFHLETPFFEENERTKLTVGKFIARNLFITYTYDVTTFSNEFNVEYFIDDRNKIQVERDETGEYSLQYKYRLRF
jgi:hypothetical protein